jgi:hypothetical protein
MIRQCFLANTGIQFYRKTFKHIGLDPTTLFPSVTTRPLALEAPCVTEAAEARASAQCRDGHVNDQVQASPMAACTFKSEEHEELLDALSPISDQLEKRKAWWILEIFPLFQFKQDRDYSLKFDWWYAFSPPFPHLVTHVGVTFFLRPNLGRGRQIPKPVCEKKKVLVHRSVKTRMDADCLEEGKYIPKANFEHYEVEWVDSSTCRPASSFTDSVPVRSFSFIYASSSALLVLFWYLTASRPRV